MNFTRWTATCLGTAIICAALTALVVAGPSSAASTTCPNADAQPAELSVPKYNAALLCLLNAERRAHGLVPLKQNRKLARAALGHSSSMATGSYFAHTEPGGRTFLKRVRKSGYARGAAHWVAGENIGAGAGGLGTPAALMTGFMNSPEHRANILDPAFREIGIGSVRGAPTLDAARNGITLTNDFGARRFG